MASLLAKRMYCFCPNFHQHHQYISPFQSLLRLSLSTQSHQSKEVEEVPFVAQYLISSFGFSPDRALKLSASKFLGCIKAPNRPDSVVSFLQEIGLSDSQVRSLISFQPILLRCNVDKILKPRAQALIDAGFSGEIFIALILSNPLCLSLKDTLSRLQFWKNFVGDNDDTLLKVIGKNRLLIHMNISKHIMPRINLLKEYGLSDQQIVKLISTSHGLLSKNLDELKWVLKQTEELGILRESNMFPAGLKVVAMMTKERLEKRVEYFIKMYGWSEDDIGSVFKKCPQLFTFSEETIKSKMDFLIKKASFDVKYIVGRPRMLSCSLDGVLKPRHFVFSALKAKGLENRYSFWTACLMPEKLFLNKILLPYKKDLPELHEAYVAVRNGKVVV